jgi:hypothetical protein
VFLAVDAPMFGVAGELVNPEDAFHEYTVTVTASDGTVDGNGHIGWSNYNIDLGGDFAITNSAGTDQHSGSYQMLNAGCGNSYLYSYSSSQWDGDAGYDVSTALGSWGVTQGCQSAEGGTLALYAAMRPSHYMCGYEAPTGFPLLSKPSATTCSDSSPPVLACVLGTVAFDWSLAELSWGTGVPLTLSDLLTLDDNAVHFDVGQAQLAIAIDEVGKDEGSCRECAAVSVDEDAAACNAVAALDSASECEAVLTASSSDATDTRACTYARMLAPVDGLLVPIGLGGTVSLSDTVVFDALPAREGGPHRIHGPNWVTRLY